MLAANVQCVGAGGDCRGHTAGGGGGLTLLVPSLSGCAESCGGFSVTAWRGLNLLRVWLRLHGWCRGLRRRLAPRPSAGVACQAGVSSPRCGGSRRWTGGVGGGRRRSCGSGRWTAWSGVALLGCSEALHDGGDPHGFLQEDTRNLSFLQLFQTLFSSLRNERHMDLICGSVSIYLLALMNQNNLFILLRHYRISPSPGTTGGVLDPPKYAAHIRSSIFNKPWKPQEELPGEEDFTFHLALAKFFSIWAHTFSLMFLSEAAPPEILSCKYKNKRWQKPTSEQSFLPHLSALATGGCTWD